MTERDPGTWEIEPARALLARIGAKEVRQRIQKTLVLWELGYLREALSGFRVAAEEDLRRIVRSRAIPEAGRAELERELDGGQPAKLVERLYREREALPARVALHLHTLLAWGNYASHHQRRGHHARPGDLGVLLAIAVDLEEWIATEAEGGSSIFDARGETLALLEERCLEAGLDPEVARVLARAPVSLEVDADRAQAVALSLELRWRPPMREAPSEEPYRGLRAFEPEDAARFHGRGRLREQLQHFVDTRRLTVISGASGSGKTSLIRAGLTPFLLELGCGVLTLSDYSERAIAFVERMLASWTRRPLTLVLDGFERALQPDLAEKLRRQILALALEPDAERPGLRVAIGIREDYLGRLLREAQAIGQGRALSEGDALFVVGPLETADLREAILRPLEGTGLEIEPRFLDERLLPDLSVGALGAVPAKLQIICGRLYREARGTERSRIDAELYQRLGGAERILAGHLDETLATARYQDSRDLARALLRALTGPGPSRWLDPWEPLAGALRGGRRDRRGRDRGGARSSGRRPPGRVSRRTRRGGRRVRADARSDRARRPSLDEPGRAGAGARARSPRPGARGLRGPGAARAPTRPRAQAGGEPLVLFASASVGDGAALELAAEPSGLAARDRGVLAFAAAVGAGFGGLQLWRAARERGRAQSAADQGILLQAQLALEHDPTLSLAWLRNLSRGARGVGVLTLLEEARRRGVAVVLLGHEELVTSVSFSPDGRQLTSASRDGSIRRWDLSTRRALGVPLRGHGDFVNRVASSPDGRLLASAGLDQTVRLWEAASSAPLGSLHGHLGAVYALAFSPGGKQLASAGSDGQVRIWEVASRRAVQVLVGHRGQAMALCFLAEDRLASAGLDGTIRLWDTNRGLALGEAPLLHRGGAYALACSSHRRSLVSGGRDGSIRRWRVEDAPASALTTVLRPIAPLSEGGEWVLAVAFSPDGRYLASAGAARGITHLGARLGAPARGTPPRPPRVRPRCPAFSPDGRRLASASRDGSVRLWDLADSEQPGMRLRGHAAEVRALAFSPRGSVLASASRDGELRIWDPSTRRTRSLSRILPGGVRALAFSPDGGTLAAAGEQRALALCDLGSDGIRSRLLPVGAGSPFRALGFSQGGLGAVDGDGALQRWDRSGRALGPAVGLHAPLQAAAFARSGEMLGVAGRDRTLGRWDLEGRRLGPIRESRASVLSLAVDRMTLVAGDSEGAIELFPHGAGTRPEGLLRGHRHWVLAVALSPDGRTLASGSADATVRLWDLGERRPIGPTLVGHSDWVEALAFSPDGKLLASGSADRTIWLWRLSGVEEDLARLEGTIDRLTNLRVDPDGRVELR